MTTRKNVTICVYCSRACRGRCKAARQARQVAYGLEASAKGRPTWEAVHGRKQVTPERAAELEALRRETPMREQIAFAFGSVIKYQNLITGEVTEW